MSRSLYGQDFYAWAKEQARAVHSKSRDRVEVEPLAASQTRLPLKSFPDQCPWTPEQLQDAGFLPEG
jgi:hypothetical protein